MYDLSFKQVVAKMASLMSERALLIGLNFLVFPIVARYLLPSELGVLQLVLSMYAIAGTVANFGMNSILVNKLVETRSRAFFRDAFKLRFGACCLGSVVLGGLFAVNDLFEGGGYWMFLILIPAVLLKVGDVYEFLMVAQVRHEKIAVVNSINTLVTSGLRLVFVFLKTSVVAFVVVAPVEQLIKVIAYYRLTRKIPVGEDDGVANLRSLIGGCMPMFMTGLMVVALSNLDRFLIVGLADEKELGLYYGGIRLVDFYLMLPVAFMSIWYPIMSSMKSDKERYEKTVRLGLSVLMYSGLGLVVLIGIWGKEITLLFLGNQYGESVGTLQIYVWTAFFVSIAVLKGNWLIIAGLMRYNMYNTFVGVVTCVVANLILIPRMGIEGAALSAVITRVVMTFVTSIFFPRQRIFLREIVYGLLLPIQFLYENRRISFRSK